jgi:SNF2 family DNA or RNA helicase
MNMQSSGEGHPAWKREAGYLPRHSPYSHQSEAAGLLDRRIAFALFLDMGTGKTKIILDEFQKECSKPGGLTDLLIIAPAGSYSNWVTEVGEHLDPRLRELVAIAKWKSGHAKSLKMVEELLTIKSLPRILIVNVEALSVVMKAKETCIKFLTPGKATVVIDESTSIKSITARRTRFLNQFVSPMAKRRRILSGLPSPNSPLDLFAQFRFLDGKVLGTSFNLFRSQYAILQRKPFGPGGRMINVVVGYRNVDDLFNLIKPHSYRKTKEECLDLPPKVYMPPRVVDMTADQKRLYREIKENASSRIEGEAHVTASLVITQMLRLHQVLCGHVVDEDGKVHEVPTNRLDELVEVLDQHSGKAVIWANYNHSIRAIEKRLKEEYGNGSTAVFYGGNAGTRLEDERRWKTDPSCRFLVASQGAGSLGNTWVEADLVVYFSNDFSLEHRMQSEDRTHRSGQTESVTYVDLMTPETIDEKIIAALRNKINLSSQITGDNYKEWLV